MKKVFIALLAAAALLSCNKRESATAVPDNDLTVRFSTNLQTFTVKGETVLDGKTVRVFAGAPINATALATAADNKLSPETPIRWVKGQVGTTTFASLYPAEISEAPSFEYDLMYEGSQNFDYHVDVLTATTPDVQPESTVHLTYKHPFALLQIKVKSEKELPEGTVPAVELSDVVVKGNFDLAAGTVQIADETATVPATLKDDLYQVLIMPQTANPLLTVKVGDKTYKFQVKEAVEFQANKRYSSEITISEAPSVEMDYDVDDWENEENPVNFEEQGSEAVVWKVRGLGGDWTWENGITMTCTTEGENPGEGVWEADITYAEGDKFKLCNGNTADAIWAGMKSFWQYYGTGDFEDGYLDATSEGIDIVLEGAGNYHLTFTYPSCKFVVSGEAPADEVVLTFYIKAAWENICLYTWNGVDVGNWPGTQVTATETVNEVVYKKFEFKGITPKTFNYIINNGNSGSGNQTADLTYEFKAAGEKFFIEVKADGSIVE